MFDNVFFISKARLFGFMWVSILLVLSCSSDKKNETVETSTPKVAKEKLPDKALLDFCVEGGKRVLYFIGGGELFKLTEGSPFDLGVFDTE